MPNRFLSSVGFFALLALLVGFAAGSVETKAPARLPAKSISEIPITHHFNYRPGPIGGLVGTFQYPPLSQTLPVDVGMALAQITVHGVQYNTYPVAWLILNVNGAEAWRGVPDKSATIVPPLIIPPGASIEMGHDGANQFQYVDLTVTGYTLDAAYFGGP